MNNRASSICISLIVSECLITYNQSKQLQCAALDT
jgi:hypothetical protein